MMDEKIIKVTVFCLFTLLTVLCKSINGQMIKDMKKENVSYTERVENCMSETQVAVDVVDEFREGGYMSNDEKFKVFLLIKNYKTKN